jgi:hypothetical protein
MKKALGFVVVMLILAMCGAAFAATGGHLDDVTKVNVSVTTVTTVEAGNILGSGAPTTVLTSVTSLTVDLLNEVVLQSVLAASFPSAEKLTVATLFEVSGSAGLNVVKLESVTQFSNSDFKFFLRTSISGGVTPFTYAGAGLVTSGLGARSVSVPVNTYAFVNADGGDAGSYPTASRSYLVVNVPDNGNGDLDPAVGVVSIQPILATAAASDNGGGGGCNAGFAASAVLVLLSAGFALSRKRSL